MRMGARGHVRWTPQRWFVEWDLRQQPATQERLHSRNELQRFRLVLAKKERMITLDLPEAVPSLNKLLGIHWAEKHRIRTRWAWLVRAAIMNDHVKVVLVRRARVTINRYSSRTLDADNMVGGAKFLIDSLVKEGFLVDDSPEHVTTQYFQHINKTQRTIVHIEAA